MGTNQAKQKIERSKPSGSDWERKKFSIYLAEKVHLDPQTRL